jgi:hypothetical protein
MCLTRTRGSAAASASSRAGVASVEPSSTKISSTSGSVCASSEPMQSSMWWPGSNTGTITLTFTGGRVFKALARACECE